MIKICEDCFDEFNATHGNNLYCSKCRKLRDKATARRSKLKNVNTLRAYYRKHREALIERSKEYYKNHKEYCKKQGKKWKKEHPHYNMKREHKLNPNMRYYTGVSKQPGYDVKRQAEYAKRNPEKRKVIWLVRYAIKTGKLIKQPCEICGEIKVVAHHDDYNKPLKVKWLCYSHHKSHHRKTM